MWIILTLITVLVALWAYAQFVLSGENHDTFDDVHKPAVNQGQPPSQAHHDVVKELGSSQAQTTLGDKSKLLPTTRTHGQHG